MRKRADNPTMASFRLSQECQRMLEEGAAALNSAHPTTHSKTDVIEIAVREWHKKNLKKLSGLS